MYDQCLNQYIVFRYNKIFMEQEFQALPLVDLYKDSSMNEEFEKFKAKVK